MIHIEPSERNSHRGSNPMYRERSTNERIIIYLCGIMQQICLQMKIPSPQPFLRTIYSHLSKAFKNMQCTRDVMV